MLLYSPNLYVEALIPSVPLFVLQDSYPAELKNESCGQRKVK